MAEKDHKPRPPLKPLEGDKDLYYIKGLRRDEAEMERFRESVIEDASRLRTEEKTASKSLVVR
jgi:hypothetical protein